GMVTPLGHSACDTWQAMVEGRPGITAVTSFDASDFDSRVAGEVKDFDPTRYMDRKEAKRADRFVQFAFVAADEALKQAKYTIPEDGSRVATIIGSALGGVSSLSEGFHTLHTRGPGRVSPFLIP